MPATPSSAFQHQTGHPPAQEARPFNKYIVSAVDQIMSKRVGQGYGGAYTQPLNYTVKEKAIDPLKPPLTMCVAAVGETILEALNLYYGEASEATEKEARRKAIEQVQSKSWQVQGSALTDIVKHLFMNERCTCEGIKVAADNGIKSYDCDRDTLKKIGQQQFNDRQRYNNSKYVVDLSTGTANALQKFGMGKQVSMKDGFRSLVDGDFINFNRPGTGHAVVFRGYITKSGSKSYTSETDVIGFRYFSSQRSTKGLKEKQAYFGNCTIDETKDCNIERDSMVMGYMFAPKDWAVEDGTKRVIEDLRSRNLVACEIRKKKLQVPQENALKEVLGAHKPGEEINLTDFFQKNADVLNKMLPLPKEKIESNLKDELFGPVPTRVPERLLRE